MINIDSLNIEKLNYGGLKLLVEWAETEGWNPGPFDAEIFWNADPNAYYGIYMNGELIAGGAIVSYNGEFGFMGLFIVKPEFRDLGIGRKLWYRRRNMLVERLNPGAAIGMDGVVAMQPFYNKGGFDIAFKGERYEKIGMQFKLSENIEEIRQNDLQAIQNYDEQRFGFARHKFIIPWLNIPGNKLFKYQENNIIKGYVVARKVAVGYKVGPLFAEDRPVAEDLYRACLNAVVGEPLYIDIPTVNGDAIRMIEEHKAKYVFECARMYHGEPPAIDMDKVYGITTFELG